MWTLVEQNGEKVESSSIMGEDLDKVVADLAAGYPRNYVITIVDGVKYATVTLYGDNEYGDWSQVGDAKLRSLPEFDEIPFRVLKELSVRDILSLDFGKFTGGKGEMPAPTVKISIWGSHLQYDSPEEAVRLLPDRILEAIPIWDGFSSYIFAGAELVTSGFDEELREGNAEILLGVSIPF